MTWPSQLMRLLQVAADAEVDLIVFGPLYSSHGRSSECPRSSQAFSVDCIYFVFLAFL